VTWQKFCSGEQETESQKYGNVGGSRGGRWQDSGLLFEFGASGGIDRPLSHGRIPKRNRPRRELHYTTIEREKRGASMDVTGGRGGSEGTNPKGNDVAVGPYGRRKEVNFLLEGEKLR